MFLNYNLSTRLLNTVKYIRWFAARKKKDSSIDIAGFENSFVNCIRSLYNCVLPELQLTMETFVYFGTDLRIQRLNRHVTCFNKT